MKNLLRTRFLSFGFSPKMNEIFENNLESFDLAKLEPVMKAEAPHKYLESTNDYFLNLVYILANMDNAMLNFKKKNIPDDIALDSLNDARVWVTNLYNMSGEIGLKTIDWECFIHRAEIIKIGRLQFQPRVADWESPAHGLKKGDNILNMHIQEGPGMTPEACRDSVARAREFFKKYFPDFKYEHMVCSSWLLDPALVQLLKPDSNIVAFRKMFDVVNTTPSESAMVRIYGPDYQKPFAELPESSSLQKNMKAYLLGGGKLSCGYGVLKSEL